MMQLSFSLLSYLMIEIGKSFSNKIVRQSFIFCRYVPSFIPPPLASKGKDSEKKVSVIFGARALQHTMFHLNALFAFLNGF